MSAHCCAPPPPSTDPGFRRALWIALAINLAMGVVELAAGGQAGSVSLLADAIDFFGDAANYGVSLAVLGLALAVRARAALLKAACMGAFGVFVLGRALWGLWTGDVPEPLTMGVVAVLALAANVGVALMLYRHRQGDANQRSVWICSRNDAIGNVAVGLAAVGVLGTGSAWPDLLVASLMAALAISGAWAVLRQARGELSQRVHRHPPEAPSDGCAQGEPCTTGSRCATVHPAGLGLAPVWPVGDSRRQAPFAD